MKVGKVKPRGKATFVNCQERVQRTFTLVWNFWFYMLYYFKLFIVTQMASYVSISLKTE